MRWTSKIRATVGTADQVVGLHPMDEKRTKKLFRHLKKAGMSLSDVQSGYRDYFQRQGCPQAHIDRQLERVERFYR